MFFVLYYKRNIKHFFRIDIQFYNIANVNSERWLAKSRVDITLCQHGKFPASLLLKFFVLYYKRNIKHFFRIDIQLYQHSWKLEKLEIVVFLVFPISTRVDITVYQHGKCFIFLKYQHSWKLEKLEIVWKHSALRASCFHTISRFSNFHSCWYNCISTWKMFYISLNITLYFPRDINRDIEALMLN